jgi:hypothetical protein
VLVAATHEGQLEARYRRVLSFGDVLDESIQLYRRHWITFALVSAVLLIPSGLIEVLISLSGALDTSFLVSTVEAGVLPPPGRYASLVGAILAGNLLSGLFVLAWTVSIVNTTNAYLHSVEPRFGVILRRTLRRFGPTLLAGLVYVLGLILLSLAALVPIVLFPVGLLGLLAAPIGSLVWWLRPTARKTWLKWVIVVATPFGLPIYFSGKWSMFVAGSVLEAYGPMSALRRSAELVDHHWFRVVATLAVGGLIVGVLQFVPSTLIQVPLTVSAAARGTVGLGPTELAISTATSIVVTILFASLGSIVYTLVFVDLRNRREGTDIAERVSLLEAAPASDG